jgi:PBP1b-binding outer membrane lipoprotein LpoB
MKTNKLTKKLHLILALLLLLLILAFQGCAQQCSTSQNEAESASAVCTTDIQSQPENAAKLSPSDMIPRITIEELKRKMDNRSTIIIVDNRSQAEFDVYHIKGAICVPLVDVAAGGWTLPVDKELVFYCA